MKIGSGPDGGSYSTTIDDSTTNHDSFSASSAVCDIGFKRENLENKQHVIVVKTLGVSPQAPVGSTGGLDFEGLMCVYSLSSTCCSLPDFVMPF